MPQEYGTTEIVDVKAAQGGDSILVVAELRTGSTLDPTELLELAQAVRETLATELHLWEL